MARLDFYVNYELQASLRLDGSSIAVGRDPANELLIPDPAVSRRHAVVSAVADGGEERHCIENFGVNGTKVNGEPLEGVRQLHAGDAIFISSYILIYQTDDAPPEELSQGTVILG